MSTSQSETARINGAKSCGPITAEGKAISARNSLRHGLRAKEVVLPTESREDYEALRDAYIQRFQPADPVEEDLVESMAAARWRLRRISAIETSLLEKGIETAIKHKTSDQHLAYSFHSSETSFANLTRYENALNRTFDRALKQLQLLQKSRPATAPGFVRQVLEPPPPPEAAAPLPRPQTPPETTPSDPLPPKTPPSGTS